ncbi:hypothetical protein IMG5_095090 [Ichthyophthirius multifiliis]|uniref:Transmembrane protein n=1 Tax=Ichthyophthirius multifiliis TaxID=5932 RepID=G0QRM3_ICHMU|nr:hypothetical protein IMG5_095090 [Ichthyophthirius multifiliis]EGR32144.1 hypothetical protein IMG5_095090 [Ichthyophthirius multifiliis]|eukprot:XP_004035630.1 hypothetical protein IMG5_095090 [Ichthyophthirius multifiliis]
MFGALILHKKDCNTNKCPCKMSQFNNLAGDEKPTISGGMVIDLGKDLKIKGVDFPRLSQSMDIFEIWFMEYIDFSFEKLITDLIRKNQEEDAQEVSLRYWFFLIKFKKNQIKALYQNKVMANQLKNKGSFFCTVERSLTNLIENRIKERDKAHFYSYSQKDRYDAVNNSKFDVMVNSETIKDKLKKLLGILIQDKCQYFENMIKGFNSLEKMRVDTLEFLKYVQYFEKTIQEEINKNKGNIYFLKFKSLLSAYVLFDPLHCKELEQEFDDVIIKDKAQDSSNTITSCNILQGNVGSIIASFQSLQNNGKILKFSEKIPSIFSYGRQEFQLIVINIQIYIFIYFNKNKYLQFLKENIKFLIPNCISILHDYFLKRLVNTGVAKSVRNFRPMFGLDQGGYIFKVKLFINYYFVKQDDFAFSSLIVKQPSNFMFIILNSSGYIEGICKGFAQLIHAEDMDQQFMKKCHIAFLIPQFMDFLQKFNKREEYSFLKFKMIVPKGFFCFFFFKKKIKQKKDTIKMANSFIQHHSNFQNLKSFSKEWINNINSFTCGVQLENNKETEYEITFNFYHEFFHLEESEVLLYYVEIQSYVFWDEVQNSIFSTGTNQSKNSNNNQNLRLVNQELQEKDDEEVEDEDDDQQESKKQLEIKKQEEEEEVEKEIIIQTEVQQGLITTEIDESNNYFLNTQHQEQINQIIKSNNSNEDCNNNKQQNNENQEEESKDSVKISVAENEDKVDIAEHFKKMNQANNNNNNYEQGSQSNSVNSSTNVILKSIITNTSSQDTPAFMLLLYTVFLFQFTVFITVVIVLVITTSQNFNDYTSGLNEMGRQAKLLLPVSQTLISTDLVCLKNLKLGYQYDIQIHNFLISQIQTSYDDYKEALFNLIGKQVKYSYQNSIFDFTLEAIVKADNKESQVQLYYTEFLKKVGESIYQLTLENIQKLILEQNDQRFILTNNLQNIYKLVHQSQIEVNNDVESLKSSIITLNQFSVILAIFLIILSFGFLYPSYRTLRFNSQRILMIVSRMKEEETNDIIDNLRIISKKLYSDDDEYLHLDFSNLALREQSENQVKISSQRNKAKKSKYQRQNYLYDRISKQNLQFLNFLFTLFILCLLSTVFFLIIFIYMDQFSSKFGIPAENYKNFVEACLQFSAMQSSHNILILNNLFFQKKGFQYVSNLKKQEIMQLRDDLFQQSTTFFTEKYLNIALSSEGNFKTNLYELISGRVCDLKILDEKYKNTCQNNMEGLLNRGLLNTIKTVFNIIQIQMLTKDWVQLGESKEYQESLIQLQLVIFFLKTIIGYFEGENIRIKDEFVSNLQLILILGSIFYVLIFILIIGFYMRKLKTEYLTIKKAIQIIPYKRLTEDQMTVFLLQKIMDIGR